MKDGVVKFFNDDKGFGFIKPNDGGEDIFVHHSGLVDEIREDDKVEFETEQGRKGLNAVCAVLENRATQEHSEYTIAGRSLKLMTPLELIQLKKHFQAEINHNNRFKIGRNNRISYR